MKNIFTLIVSLSIILFTLIPATVGHTNPDSVGTIPLTDDILRSKAAFAVVDEEIARHLNLSTLSEWDYQKLRGPVLLKIRTAIHSRLRDQFGGIVHTVNFDLRQDSGSPSQTPPMNPGNGPPQLHKRAAEIIRDFIDQEHISVIIRSDAPIGLGEIAAIRGLRGEVRYTYDIINGACVFVPIRNLTALIKRPFVREVWLDSIGRAALKDSVPQIGADQVHSLPGGGRVVMGEGVHVAVVDSGIDPSHPEFRGRIVDNRKVTIDTDHGTHVAGIIGSAAGVAPKVKFLDARMSGITLLRFDDSFFNSNVGYSDTLDAIKWAAHKKLILNAEEKADVINMSWGWAIWIYGRKGDDPMSELIDEVVRDGIVFVVSAGNEAQKRAIGNITPNSKPSPHTFTVYHSDYMGTVFPSITVTCVLLWDQEDSDLDLAILDSNDEEVAESRSNPFFFLGKTYKEETEHGRKKYYELVELTSESPNGVAQKYTFRVEGADVQVAQKYEVWVDSDHAAFERPNSEQAVSVPGYSEKAITVGAVDPDEQITNFSSQGPSNTDLIKPEIVAPGFEIESTVFPPNLQDEKSGTSMAAPHVAGVAALILDAVGKNDHDEWNFNPDEVKSAIVRGAEGGVGGIPNRPDNTYGAGLVRADNIIFGKTVEANKKIRFEIIPRLTDLRYGSYTLNADPALKVAISWENPAHNLDLVLVDANGKKILESNQVSSNYEKIGPPPNQKPTYLLEVHNKSGVPVTFTGAATHKIIKAPDSTYDPRVTIPVQQPTRTPVFVYWADSGTGKIQRANLDGSNIQDIVTGLDDPYSIALDGTARKIYWTDYRRKNIQRANLDGSNIQDIVTRLGFPYGIALDVAAGKVYWTDEGPDKIQRANLDGSNIQDVFIVRGLGNPRSIALDVAAGKMYWTTAWTEKIQRASLDGTNVQDLVTPRLAGLGGPSDIALDVAAGKMYWTNPFNHKIQRSNLNGTNIETLVRGGRPYGIALDIAAGKMYWTNWHTDKIQRANLDGSNVEDFVATGLVSPTGIALGVPTPKVPDLLVTVLSTSKSSLAPSENFSLSATIENHGTDEASATTLRYLKWDGTTETWKRIPDKTNPVAELSANGASTKDLTLTAPNTTGEHFYKVCVDAVPREANPDTNCYESWVTITVQQPVIAEDVNGDGVVNILDLVLVDSHFGETGENDADVNEDGIVNIADLLLVAKAVGNAAGAPSTQPIIPNILTAEEVQQWLTAARKLPNWHTYQRGIVVLEQLLVMLIPKETALLPNYPNPFNPETWIPYHLAEATEVSLTIYAVDGTVVRTLVLGHQAAGIYQDRKRAVYWDGRNTLGEPVASGVYFYTLKAGDFTTTRKMLIRK